MERHADLTTNQPVREVRLMAEVHSIGAPVLGSLPPSKQRKKPLEAHRRACTKYERKTKQGFLMRAYRNMLSRVTGVQRLKFHLYGGKPILDRQDFYAWSLASQDFHRLFDAWLLAGHPRCTAPSVDRIDSDGGYTFGNIRWVPFSENCRNIKRRKIRQPVQLALFATVCPGMLEPA